MNCQREISHNQTSGESVGALLRVGRFTSKWRCQCGCRMLSDFPGVISHMPVSGQLRVGRHRSASLIGFSGDLLFLDEKQLIHAKSCFHQVTVKSRIARHSGAIAKTSRTRPTRMRVGKRICVDSLPNVTLKSTQPPCVSEVSRAGEIATPPPTIDVRCALDDAQGTRD